MQKTATMVLGDTASLSPLRRSILFYVLAFFFSWLVWIPLVLVPHFFSNSLLILGSFGPLAAAILVSYMGGGWQGVQRWGSRAFRWRNRTHWLLLGWLLLPLLMIALQLACYRLLLGPIALQTTGDTPWYYVAALFPLNVLIAAPIGSGMGEEPGWQGVGVPGLIGGLHPLVAVLLHGAIWACWHLPAFLTTWQGDGQPLPWFFAYMIPLSVIMTWITCQARGSVIPAVLLHAATNLYSNLFMSELIFAGSLENGFIECKTATYWFVALFLLLVTRGRLGADARSDT